MPNVSKNNSDDKTQRILKKGTFYTITDESDAYILLDNTKQELEFKEKTIDTQTNVTSDKGMIHDVNGIGHIVPIRWYYQKNTYNMSDVQKHADAIEKKYMEYREITCPD